VLEQVVERGRRDVGLDRHVRRRLVGDALDHAPVDRPRRLVDHLAEPPVERAQLGLAGGDRRHRDLLGAGGLRPQLPPLALLRLARPAAVGAQATLQRAQLARGREPAALRLGERLAVGVGDLHLRVGNRGREQLHDRRGARLDERLAVAVDDVPARRLDLDLAHAVVAGLAHVVVAGQHLQEPQAEEDDREQDERDATEYGDAHRELRRDRRAAILDRRRH
jgi:hypothetical protein